jgi:nucleotide-binding universal stress UspA family protein
MAGYAKVLVPTDFSPHADAAARLAAWVIRQSGGSLVLAHVLSDLRRTVHHSSLQARLDLLEGEGELFEREIRQKSDVKLKQVALALGSGLDLHFETLLGEPFVEIIHAVQQESYDLVMMGARGISSWQRMLVGGTSQRLIRKCPCSVWIVKAEHAQPPKTILAATDLSEVSRRAVQQALWIADRAGATLHVLHVVDEGDVPRDLLEARPGGKSSRSLRNEIRGEAKRRFDEFLATLPQTAVQIQTEASWGTPWREIKRLATKMKADLIAMGTVGRSGIQGVLLGNTAEKVLATCDASILTVKPAEFVSPIQPAYWKLHPDEQPESAPIVAPAAT